MNCPKCGKPMEIGWLDGKAPVIWTPKEQKRTLISTSKDDETIVNWFGSQYPLSALICKACRKIIVDY